MKRIELADYPKDSIRLLLSGIPFFKEVATQDAEQLKKLLNNSWLMEYEAGEEVMRRGTKDNVYYFILRGNLAVYPDNQEQHHRVVNHLSTGQIFGALSLLCNRERTASIAADKNGTALLFCSDFSLFGELGDFSEINLQTKLSIYNLVVNNTRWKLELYRMEHADHPLAKKTREIPYYLGPKGTVDELHSLYTQVEALADLLEEWNNAFQSPGQFKLTEQGVEML